MDPINVFVSRPNWIATQYRDGLQRFLGMLEALSLRPRTIGATDYPVKSPLDEVIKLMKGCRGAVVLGYPQIEATVGSIKGAAITSSLLLPTEWNQIEAGLAYARELPLLVIHHIGVSRGIFDRGALNNFLFAKDLADPAWAASEEIGGALRAWRDDVLGYAPTDAPIRNQTYVAIDKNKNIVWSIFGLGRRINDPRPLAKTYREIAECRIEELTDYYVRVSILSTGEYVTLPFRDVVVSYDDKRYRPSIEVRA